MKTLALQKVYSQKGALVELERSVSRLPVRNPNVIMLAGSLSLVGDLMGE